jgi:hypothetical protein
MIGGFESQQRLGIFLFTTVSRPALEPTQPPIQWVPGALSLGVKLPEREADHSHPHSAEIKMRGAIPPLPNTPSWYCAQLKEQSTGTTLPLPLTSTAILHIFEVVMVL